MTRSLRAFLVAVDLGFVAYWLATLLPVLPSPGSLVGDHDAILASWNLSFLPLDGIASVLGLGAVSLHRRRDERASLAALASLALTSASGLMAVSFWALRCDFDPWWWLPNLVLLFGPFVFVGPLTHAVLRR